MSRMENIDLAASVEADVSEDFAADKDIQLWLKLGRMAFFFCLWSAMAIPVALIYYARF